MNALKITRDDLTVILSATREKILHKMLFWICEMHSNTLISYSCYVNFGDVSFRE